MQKKYLLLLGKQVMPLLRRGRIQGYEADKRNGNMGEWLSGEARHNHFKAAVSRAEKEAREDNKSMKWFVFSINVNGKFDLVSREGYSQGNVSRSDFRLIKNGEEY